MTKQQATKMQKEARTALDAIAKKYGMPIVKTFATIGEGDIKISITFEEPNAKENDFAMYAEMYGLKKTWFGKTFQTAGRMFTVEGLNHNARKRPVLARGDDGKQYVFQTDAVIKAFEPRKKTTTIEQRFRDAAGR